MVGIAGVLGSVSLGIKPWVTGQADATVVAMTTPLLSVAADQALRRARITPATLAAAGVNSTEAGVLFQNAADWWETNGTTCVSALGSSCSTSMTAESLMRKARAGLATTQELDDTAAACTAAGAAHAALVAQLDALWEAATDDLDSGKLAKLAVLRSNLDAGLGLHVTYLVVEHEQDEAIALRDALVEVAVNGENADPLAEGLVDDAESNTDVAAAHTALTTHLSSVTSAWVAAMTP
jgi:hypothetical protein